MADRVDTSSVTVAAWVAEYRAAVGGGDLADLLEALAAERDVAVAVANDAIETLWRKNRGTRQDAARLRARLSSLLAEGSGSDPTDEREGWTLRHRRVNPILASRLTDVSGLDPADEDGPYATEYMFLPAEMFKGAPMDTAHLYHPHAITVAWRGGATWAVLQGPRSTPQFVWSEEEGEWVYEPLPSSRTDEFIAATRFTLDEALSIGRRLAAGGGS